MLDFNRSVFRRKNRVMDTGNSRFVMDRFSQWRMGIPAGIEIDSPEDLPAIIAVGGGKGGVGKSILSANLACSLSQMGARVLVIDLDLGCSNLHTHFGISSPKRTLTDFLLKGNISFNDVILPAPVRGAAFIAGGREEEWGRKLDGNQDYLKHLWKAILSCRREFKVDIVLFDLGAGTHQHTMTFFSAAHLGIATVLPEPTSIENAYVFLKAALWKLIDNIGDRTGSPEIAEDIQMALAAGVSQERSGGYVEIFRALSGKYGAFISQLAGALRGRALGIVINQTREQSDIDIGHSMEHICRGYFGFQAKYLSYLNYDDCVWKSLKNRRMVLTDFPHSQISQRLTLIAGETVKLLGMDG